MASGFANIKIATASLMIRFECMRAGLIMAKDEKISSPRDDHSTAEFSG